MKIAGARALHRGVWVTMLTGILLVSCQREDRRPKMTPWLVSPVERVSAGDTTPGAAQATPISNRFERNAVSLSDGKRIYMWFNCVGCHANGGGGMGPPLMDAQWIYGSEPAQIVESILKGRPNGMPSFAGKIPDYQLWQLAAYVRSMSGLVRSDVAPSRSDHMTVKTPESRTPEQPPVAPPQPDGQQR